MENKGIEAQINFDAVRTQDFSWNTSVLFSANKNKLLSLSDKNIQLASGYFDAGNTGEPIQQDTHRVQVGQPIANYYGFKSVDIDDNGYCVTEGTNREVQPNADQQADDNKILGYG